MLTNLHLKDYEQTQLINSERIKHFYNFLLLQQENKKNFSVYPVSPATSGNTRPYGNK